MARTAEEKQTALLTRAEADLDKATDRLSTATARSEKAGVAKAIADAKVRTAQDEVERLERHVQWVKTMPVGPAPVPADESFGEDEAELDENELPDDVLV